MTITLPPQLRTITTTHAVRIAAGLGPVDGGSTFAGLDERLLFLCFTNRCGSNYLAQLLASTGALNEAGEFFNADTVLTHAKERSLASLRDYVRWLPSVVGHNGWVAAKAGVDQLIMLVDAGIVQPDPARCQFVLLERRDRLGQAISRVIASQNGRWTSEHASPVPDEALRYDREAIDRQMESIELANYAFYRFFAALGVAPVHLSYEAVLADPQAAVTEIGDWIGMPGLRVDPAKIRIERQAGAITEAWRARYEDRSRG